MANLFILITLALIIVSILIFMTFVKAELGRIERLLNEWKYIDRTGVDYTDENVLMVFPFQICFFCVPSLSSNPDRA